ncbi:hypothetical protein MXB_2133 [Myxobolus squamalis]|nr:hypothetical protein MXB_2133 [Myxobolus squamalis]
MIITSQDVTTSPVVAKTTHGVEVVRISPVAAHNSVFESFFNVENFTSIIFESYKRTTIGFPVKGHVTTWEVGFSTCTSASGAKLGSQKHDRCFSEESKTIITKIKRREVLDSLGVFPTPLFVMTSHFINAISAMFCHNYCRDMSIAMALQLINGSLKFSRIFFRFIHNQDVFFELLVQKNVIFSEGEVFSQKFKNQRLPLPVSEKSPFYDPREMKFINHIMKDGKKLEAYSLYHDILKELSISKFPSLTEEEKIPKTFFFKALEKLKPIIEVKDVKIYGFDKKVSIPLSPQKSRYYASKNLITALFKKRGSHKKCFCLFYNIYVGQKSHLHTLRFGKIFPRFAIFFPSAYFTPCEKPDIK